MLFDVEPKKRLCDFFAHRTEYEQLVNAIKRKDKITAIRGVRRIGKTSLMFIVYNEIMEPKIFIDGRMTKNAKEVIDEISLFIKEKNVLKSLKRIEIGIHGFNLGVELEKNTNLRELSKEIKKFKHLYIFIDEAQNIKKLDDLIAHIYDSFSNVSFILSGSEVGILDELLGEKTNSPLYGRATTTIELNRMEKSDSLKFLEEGFKETKIKSPDKFEKVVGSLEGIIGWLTLYGYYASILKLKTPLKEVREVAKKIVKNEIMHFLRKRRSTRYLTVLKYVNGLSWEEIRVIVGKKEKKIINPKQITKYLNELIKYGFLEKKGEKYWVADPIILEIFT